MPHNRTKHPVRPAPNIPKRHIRNVQFTRMLEALVLVILAIALRNGQAIVDIIQKHAIVRDIAHEAAPPAARKAGAFFRVCVGPYFDACAFARVEEADVANEYVFDVVDARGILAQ
jgi:hypothetical protein